MGFLRLWAWPTTLRQPVWPSQLWLPTAGLPELEGSRAPFQTLPSPAPASVLLSASYFRPEEGPPRPWLPTNYPEFPTKCSGLGWALSAILPHPCHCLAQHLQGCPGPQDPPSGGSHHRPSAQTQLAETRKKPCLGVGRGVQPLPLVQAPAPLHLCPTSRSCSLQHFLYAPGRGFSACGADMGTGDSSLSAAEG